MDQLIEPIAKLAAAFGRLPGVGPKSAQRMAFHVLGMNKEDVTAFGRALVYAKERVVLCERCGMYTDQPICTVCTNPKRDASVLCVVRDPRDVLALERAREYRGLYHVLHGVIAPMSGIGPDEIRIRELVERVAAGSVREVILGTNPDVEGDVTAMYIAQLLRPFGIKVSRIAHGVPVGGNLEYTDEVTLQKALEGRRELE